MNCHTGQEVRAVAAAADQENECELSISSQQIDSQECSHLVMSEDNDEFHDIVMYVENTEGIFGDLLLISRLLYEIILF